MLLLEFISLPKKSMHGKKVDSFDDESTDL